MNRFIATPIAAVLLFLLLGAGAGFATIYMGGSGKTGEINLEKGLVGHWIGSHGNTSTLTRDLTSNENNGNVTGAALTTDRKGQSNKAYDFNGTSAFISIADATGLDIGTNDFTISFWLKLDNDASAGVQILKGKAGNFNNTGYEIKTGVGSNCGTAMRFILNKGSGDAASIKNICVSNPPTGIWTHYAWVGDRDGNATTYVNGEIESTVENPIDISDWVGLDISNNEDINLGRRYSEGGYLDGALDDMRFYSSALSAAEVGALYSSYDPGVQVADTQKGLVGHWIGSHGNTSTLTRDLTSNENNGTLNGNTALTTDRKGQSNKAYTFDGTGDYVDVGNISALNAATTNFSVSLWFKTTLNTDSHTTIAAKGGNIDAETTRPGWTITKDRSGLGNNLRVVVQGATSRVTRTSDSAVNDGAWHHAVFTLDGSSIFRVYVDGVQQGVDQDASAIGSPSNSRSFGIGRHDQTASGFNSPVPNWNGQVDDVRVYSRGLTATEVTALYDSYNPVVQVADIQKGLVGNWIGPHGNSTTLARDHTPNENNGTVTGATPITDRKGQSNKAYSFNGTTDDIQVADADVLDLNTTDFTIAAWVKIDALDSTENVFVAKLDTSTHRNGYTLNVSTGNKLSTTFRKGDALFADAVISVSAASTLSTDTWYHVVGVLDRDVGGTIYVNGEEDGSTADTKLNGVDITNSSVLSIGDYTDSFPFPGDVSDVRIYNRALSAAEVQQLYETYQ